MEAFAVIRNRDPHLDECNSVGTVLESSHTHSLGWASLCSVQTAQLYMEALNERETGRDISPERLRKIIPVRHRPNSDTSEWRANCRTKYVIV